MATLAVPDLQREYLRRGAEGRHQIVTLTDEELAAVDGPRTVAPRYWYDAQAPQTRQVARTVAVRGLAARGWVAADSDATEVDDLDLHSAGPLLAVLSLRVAVRQILVSEQKDAAGARARIYYLVDGPVALEEAVNSAGLHRFSTLPTSEVAGELADWADPGRSPEPNHPWEQILATQAEVESVVADRLGNSRLVSVIVGVDRRSEDLRETRLSVYVEPGRACLTVAADGRVRIRDVGHRELRHRLATMIGVG